LVGLVRFAGKTIANIQRELNDRYSEYVKDPEIVVQVIEGDSPLQGLRDAVDARAGNGGQSRLATVSPDGTIQLPKIGSVPAIGLTLEEIEREINARYNLYYSGGVEVTSILIERAPRFIYVLGEVPQPGQIEMTGPTSVMQAIALAQGFNQGGNLRQVVVFRRDANWQLIATRLDLAAPLFGRSPNPADEIWLRDSDIVLIPKKPIQRLSEAVNLYLSTTIYSIFPQQGVAFNFDGFTAL
jgi:polysaccharide export outer membrane protein